MENIAKILPDFVKAQRITFAGSIEQLDVL